MPMHLERLVHLHNNLRAQGITKTKFGFRFRGLQFSVIYIAEQFPHELLFGCLAHNLFFVVTVSDDYTIGTYLGDVYGPLLDAMGIQPNPNNPFRPNVFFEEFSAAIPLTRTLADVPTVNEVAANRRDVEEEDRIYFCGWLPHDGIRSRPTESNLVKTRRICGQAAYEACRDYHISSRWTDQQALAQEYHEPRLGN